MTLTFSRVVNLMRLVCTSGLISLATSSCQTQAPEPAQPAPPSQRVAARTIAGLGLVLDEVNLGTVLFAGTYYATHSFDSASYQYDDRRRLVSSQGVGTSQAYGKKFSYPYGNTFGYERRRLVVGSGDYYPLDSTEQRVLSQNKKGYSYVIFDTLRQYSDEGILLSSLRGTYNPTFPDTKREKPNQVATIQGGNVVRLEAYNPWSGELETTTLFNYDLQHFAPLATETYLGETSRNALLKKTILRSAGAVSQEEYVYVNEYDSQGRLTQQLESLKEPNKSQHRALSLTHYYY